MSMTKLASGDNGERYAVEDASLAERILNPGRDLLGDAALTHNLSVAPHTSGTPSAVRDIAGVVEQVNDELRFSLISGCI